jgi:hypothetical protein
MNLLDQIRQSRQNKITTEQLSKCFKGCFAGSDGEKVLNYLTSITLQRVGQNNISNDELRHLEGQRYIVKLILNYIS